MIGLDEYEAMTDGSNNLNDPRRWWGLGEVLAVSLPASLSMASVVAMQFVDAVMVSAIPGVGPAALAAQATAGATHFKPY
jgi:Na+-driven multidrug efflux pump